MLNFGAALAREHEAARKHQVSRLFGDRVALARQQGFVDLYLPLQQDGVCADLPAALQAEDVVQHQLFHGHRLHFAIPDHIRPGSGEQGELVHQLFGLDFLENADGRIQRNDRHEKQVGPRVHGGQRQGDEQVEEVEQRADVVPDNLPGGSGDFLGRGVLQAVLFLAEHLLGREAVFGRGI